MATEECFSHKGLQSLLILSWLRSSRGWSVYSGYPTYIILDKLKARLMNVKKEFGREYLNNLNHMTPRCLLAVTNAKWGAQKVQNLFMYEEWKVNISLMFRKVKVWNWVVRNYSVQNRFINLSYSSSKLATKHLRELFVEEMLHCSYERSSRAAKH